jgi:hypothetical protein
MANGLERWVKRVGYCIVWCFNSHELLKVFKVLNKRYLFMAHELGLLPSFLSVEGPDQCARKHNAENNRNKS